MTEQPVEIRTPDGVADGFVLSPGTAQRCPGVIHLTDIGGIRPSHRAMAERLAASGFAVLLPNVFYRTGRPPMFDFAPKMGDERTMKRFGELATPMTPQAQERDAAAYIDFLAAHPAVSAGPLGVVGYCFTGGMAMRAAAVRPDRVAGAASFHGGGLYTDAPTSPHLALARIKARLYFGFAIKDQSMSEEAIEKLKLALAAWGGKFEAETYDGAYHGWTSSDSPVYNAAQADRAFDKLSALFAQTLKQE
jgi:carboxymethylenebutenolidase